MVKSYTLHDIQLKLQSGDHSNFVDEKIKSIVHYLNTNLVEINPILTNNYSHDSGMKQRPKNQNENGFSYPIDNNGRRKTNRFPQQHTSIESWIAVRKFKPTKIEVKEGIEKNLNEIRTVLNKITNKNYDTQKELVFQLIEKNILSLHEMNEETGENNSEQEQSEMMNCIGNFIFDISSTNKFYSELYANLYKELIEKYTLFLDILHSYLTSYKNVKITPYVDSNKDYDGYCEYTKSNDKRRSTIHFFILLMKRNILESNYMLELAKLYISIIEEQIDQENFTNEIDEYTELTSIIITNGKDNFHGEEYQDICNKIRTISCYKMKEKKGLSSRSLFKYKDLVKILV